MEAVHIMKKIGGYFVFFLLMTTLIPFGVRTVDEVGRDIMGG